MDQNPTPWLRHGSVLIWLYRISDICQLISNLHLKFVTNFSFFKKIIWNRQIQIPKSVSKMFNTTPRDYFNAFLCFYDQRVMSSIGNKIECFWQVNYEIAALPAFVCCSYDYSGSVLKPHFYHHPTFISNSK